MIKLLQLQQQQQQLQRQQQQKNNIKITRLSDFLKIIMVYHKSILFIVFIIFITIASVCFLDLKIVYIVNKFSSLKIYNIFKFITFFGSLSGIILINILLFFKQKRIVILELIMLQVVLALFLQIIKFIFGRIRPILLDNIIIDNAFRTFTFFSTNYKYTSFPSGHSFSSFVLLKIIFSVFYKFFSIKYRKLMLVSIFITIPISRIIMNLHFISDILFGLLFGYYLTGFFLKKSTFFSN